MLTKIKNELTRRPSRYYLLATLIFQLGLAMLSLAMGALPLFMVLMGFFPGVTAALLRVNWHK